MKRTLALLLSLTLLLTLCACARQQAPQDGDAMPTVLNTNEYVLYQNIFFNGQAGDYTGKTATKTGTFAILRDQFNEVDRYYVWGYNDATKCCDWQWEFVPQDPQALPPVGSLVEMTGTLTQSDSALDGYWFTDAKLKVKTEYHGADCDVDMSAMSATLERVQILNMQYYPDYFEGKSLVAYGRILEPTVLQHPYYDSAWTQSFEGSTDLAIGTVVLVQGSYEGGVIRSAQVEATNAY